MAEEINKSQEYGQSGSEEVKDRGLFDFLGKKDDDHKEESKPAEYHHAHDHDHHDYKPQEQSYTTEFDQKVTVSEAKPEHHDHHYVEPPKHEEYKPEEYEEKKPEKLHRSNSSSSSSSEEEEEGENGEKIKKKKKKGLKEKIFGKGDDEKKEEKYEATHENTNVPIEKYDDAYENQPEEKKGFLEKIKEKLPGKKSGGEETVVVAPAAESYSHEAQAHHGEYHQEAGKDQKKGILEKIKEKLPGYHHKGDEEKEKEKDKDKEYN